MGSSVATLPGCMGYPASRQVFADPDVRRHSGRKACRLSPFVLGAQGSDIGDGLWPGGFLLPAGQPWLLLAAACTRRETTGGATSAHRDREPHLAR